MVINEETDVIVLNSVNLNFTKTTASSNLRQMLRQIKKPVLTWPFRILWDFVLEKI